MKARRIIGGILAVIGLAAAVSVADGSSYEIGIRLGGTALFAAGCFIARLFDFQI